MKVSGAGDPVCSEGQDKCVLVLQGPHTADHFVSEPASCQSPKNTQWGYGVLLSGTGSQGKQFPHFHQARQPQPCSISPLDTPCILFTKHPS